ncbi:MAG: protelomerase family protein [Jaaginema sp. PMC 1078.18]|nr:protelomerase family protein [Jaaginema sp. PMC 1078.18]
MPNTYIDKRVSILLPQLEALAPFKPRTRRNGKDNISGWKQLVIDETVKLKLTYPDPNPEQERTYGTCLRQISALKKALQQAAQTDLKDPSNYHRVLTIIGHFGEALSFQFAEYKARQNANYCQQIIHRSEPENLIEIDLTPYLQQAHQVLEQTWEYGFLEEYKWVDVSCAIALVTGRRMAEIHLSATFEEIGEYEIGFTGQLKGKSRKIQSHNAEKAIKLRNFRFEIPTLVKAEYVCAGLEWLEEEGKRLDPNDDPSRVNRRYSKPLSKGVKERWDFMGEDTTYHKLRSAYLFAVMENEVIDESLGSVASASRLLKAAAQYLGDEGNMVENYIRFKAKPGMITRV